MICGWRMTKITDPFLLKYYFLNIENPAERGFSLRLGEKNIWMPVLK